MAVKTFDELMSAIADRTKDMTDDETLQFIEDVSDTLKNYEELSSENANWKEKFETNDKEWRERYRERFFTAEEKTDDDDGPEPEPEVVKKTYEDLFEEEED